jgi:uncharacterized protein YxjI
MSVSDLLHRDVMVIKQKPKLIEMTKCVSDPRCRRRRHRIDPPSGQSKVKKALRLFTDVDQFLTHRLGVYDGSGAKVMAMVRPRKILKSTLQILDAGGVERGRIVQQNVVGKKRFALQSPQGDEIGSIDAENWRSWDFAIHDASGAEVGRITKQWAGVLREGFTTTDHYMFQVTGALSPDLRFLMVAAAAGVDTALKQDDTGGFGFGGLDLFDR